MDPKELEVTPEEQTAEKEALAEVNTDELKTKIAEEMGIDPDTEADLLDKVVEREKTNRERLSKAIKQKIKFRDQLKPSDKSKSDKSDKGESQTPNISELVATQVAEQLEQRDLASLQLADELKEEIKDLAKLKKISIKDASELPYIKSRKETMEREQKIINASPKRKGGGTHTPTYDVTKGAPSPEDFDLNSPEGRKDWDQAKTSFRNSRSRE